MTTIDIENAKQIRQPMDVIIQIAAAETATLTYSGYSAAKVADGELDEPDWPMRKLADLQGDGFLLDGSAVLYDSTVTASAENGKLGVRSVIGTAISVTVTSDVALQYLTVTASGAESVTYNGTAYSMTSGYALIPVGGGTSFTLTFAPAAADERIEISDIQPGALIRITNDNLISAVVSLRSDLSILDPTLPESEINIEAYFDTDISEILASIPDETPVTYQAGYEGDMSPVRKFYLAEQITWADNVMRIHAVDAVHLLDAEVPFDLLLDNAYVAVYRAMRYMLERVGISYDYEALTASSSEQGGIIMKKGPCREIVKNLMWLMGPNKLSASRWFIPRFVDAGIPKLSHSAGQSLWTINENDCGDINRNVDRKISSITFQWDNLDLLTGNNIIVGSYDWYKNTGAFLNIDEDTYWFSIAVPDGTAGETSGYGNWAIIPTNVAGTTSENGPAPVIIGGARTYDVQKLFGPDLPQNEMVDGAKEYYTQFVPWGCAYGSGWGSRNSQLKAWNFLTSKGAISADADSISLDLFGQKFGGEKETRTVTASAAGGVAINMLIDDVKGNSYAPNTSAYDFPSGLIGAKLNISPITGSFTWKGDPRMHPRDVFTFHRLDGTDEVCTLENITITHEKGGTSAEITYRKGVC